MSWEAAGLIDDWLEAAPLTLLKDRGNSSNEEICGPLGPDTEAVAEAVLEAGGRIDAVGRLEHPPSTGCKAGEMILGPSSVEGSEAIVSELG